MAANRANPFARGLELGREKGSQKPKPLAASGWSAVLPPNRSSEALMFSSGRRDRSAMPVDASWSCTELLAHCERTGKSLVVWRGRVCQQLKARVPTRPLKKSGSFHSRRGKCTDLAIVRWGLDRRTHERTEDHLPVIHLASNLRREPCPRHDSRQDSLSGVIICPAG